MVPAALTHACQMVELMAFYLDVNLPKTINYRFIFLLFQFCNILYRYHVLLCDAHLNKFCNFDNRNTFLVIQFPLTHQS